MVARCGGKRWICLDQILGKKDFIPFLVFSDQILIFLYITLFLLFRYFHFYPGVCTFSVVIVSTDLFEGFSVNKDISPNATVSF
jgi:hypothetical protein